MAGEGGSNGSLRGVKGTTWEGGMRVPLLARWPGTLPKGTVCEDLTAAIDFLPTFARLAGVSLDDGVERDGLAIPPLPVGKTTPRTAPADR